MTQLKNELDVLREQARMIYRVRVVSSCKEFGATDHGWKEIKAPDPKQAAMRVVEDVVKSDIRDWIDPTEGDDVVTSCDVTVEDYRKAQITYHASVTEEVAYDLQMDELYIDVTMSIERLGLDDNAPLLAGQ